MMNLPTSIVVGSMFIAVGIFYGFKTVAYSFDRIWMLLHDLHINVNHFCHYEEGEKK